MFSKVLFPTEFSPNDDKLLNLIIGFKKIGLRELYLTHVSNPVGLEQPLVEKFESELVEILNKREKIMEREKIKTEPVLLLGVPHEEILKLSAEKKVSAIVAGTRGKKLIEELIKGSTSELVGRRAKVPVLLVRYRNIKDLSDKKIKEMGQNIFKKILFPIDFSEGSEIALNFIKGLDPKECDEIILLHVIEEKEVKTEESKESLLRHNRRVLSGIKVELESRGLKVEYRISIGPVIAEILDMENLINPTVLVVGPHGKGVTEELFLGSVSQNLVRTSSVPVILVH